MTQLFVYGSLKSSEWNHRYLDGSEFLGHLVVPNFQLFQSGIPYMIFTGHPPHRVHGEVYRIDDRMLERLDHLEGHPDWYRREDVSMFDHKPVQAYVFRGYLTPHAEESPKDEAGVYYFG